MKFFKKSKFLSLIFIIYSSNIYSQDQANDGPSNEELLEQAISIEASSSNAAADRQDYINRIDSQIIELIGDIQYLSQQLDLTNIYNRKMQELITSQNNEIESINQQMVELDNTNRGILPKLEEMVLTLESIIQNDIPFLLTERNLRVIELKEILMQSNVSTSEKFRRVFEAYQIENEYGRTIESYRDEISVEDNCAGISKAYEERAFDIGNPNQNIDGIGTYGMGMKVSACWYSDTWTVETKAIDEDVIKTW